MFAAYVLRIAGLCALLALTGCSTWITGGFEDPDVKLLKVEVVKAKLLRQDFKLRLRVDNPNDSSLLVRGLRYKIMLNDMLLSEGVYSDWFIVKASRTSPGCWASLVSLCITGWTASSRPDFYSDTACALDAMAT
jgi:LEA14-like dessication related protein